jgi:hypothetical protein
MYGPLHTLQDQEFAPTGKFGPGLARQDKEYNICGKLFFTK